MTEPIKSQRGGKRAGAGRPPLPPDKRLCRIVVYVDPCVEEWVSKNGGSIFAAAILTAAHAQSLIV